MVSVAREYVATFREVSLRVIPVRAWLSRRQGREIELPVSTHSATTTPDNIHGNLAVIDLADNLSVVYWRGEVVPFGMRYPDNQVVLWEGVELSEIEQRNLAQGRLSLLFLLWALAPTIAAVLCIGLALFGPPSFLGVIIVLYLSFSPVSQFMWSLSFLKRQGAPDKWRGIKAVLITLIGLFVNAAIFIGGCRCMLDSVTSPVSPGTF